jgi:hypothetical protein
LRHRYEIVQGHGARVRPERIAGFAVERIGLVCSRCSYWFAVPVAEAETTSRGPDWARPTRPAPAVLAMAADVARDPEFAWDTPGGGLRPGTAPGEKADAWTRLKPEGLRRAFLRGIRPVR